MSTKKRSNKKEEAGKQPKATKKKDEDDKAEKPFDFGGLPDRDLKKNLGCG